MGGPRKGSRSRRASGSGAAALLAAVLLVGCTPATQPDPALRALAGDALSATRAAELGIRLAGEDRILVTTERALLDDMAEDLADTARELQLYQPATAVDGELRLSLLEVTRGAGEAVHRAQQGGADTADELQKLGRELAQVAEG